MQIFFNLKSRVTHWNWIPSLHRIVSTGFKEFLAIEFQARVYLICELSKEKIMKRTAIFSRYLIYIFDWEVPSRDWKFEIDYRDMFENS